MKKVYLILSILIIILVGLSLYMQKNKPKKNSITIELGDNVKSVEFDEIEKLKHNSISNIKGENLNAVALEEIIKLITNKKITKAIIKSRDGMGIELDKRDITNAYLVLKTKNNEQYYRLVISTDEFSQRWIKYISSMILTL